MRRRRSAKLLTLAALVAGSLLATAAPSGAAPQSFGGGQLDWGVKQSFRTYIATIALGTYTASEGAEVVSPGGVVRFDVLGGSYDDATGAGELTIGGKVRFEGHGGALDLTIHNLCVTFAGGSGTTYADVVSKDRDSGQVDSYVGIPLVNMASVPAPVAIGGDAGLEWSSIATTLDAAAVPAFGQYQAGEEFDPLAPLSATFGAPTARPGGAPCRGVPPDDGGGGPDEPGGGGGPGGGSGGGGAPGPTPTTPVIRRPEATAVAGPVFVARSRVATVGKLRCGSARCAIDVPKSVRVRIAGKRYLVTVLAPKGLAPDGSGKLRVKLTKAARGALAGRRAALKLKVTVVADGRTTTKTIKVNLRARRAGNDG